MDTSFRRHPSLGAIRLGLSVASVFGASSQGAELKLPDLLTTVAGSPVRSEAAWRGERRPELLELFRAQVYGRMPSLPPGSLAFTTNSVDRGVMGGKATRKQISVRFTGPRGTGELRLLLFVPSTAKGPSPCLLFLCNRGRSNIDADRATPNPFWPAEEMVARGYAAATFLVGDVAPDRNDGCLTGAFQIFDPPSPTRARDAWGTIAAWAWGASRAMDYLATDPDIDARRTAVVGHSRGGKAALWCGAEDPRFALVISNDSGCTGAALARGNRGETVQVINSKFPHWFCTNFKRYNNNEASLPVDQHMLIALMAPRLVYVASASEDSNADPEAEFRACVEASPAYRLFGLRGLPETVWPKPGEPLQAGEIGYHVRAGTHDLTPYDWSKFMNFADRHWKR